MRWVKQFIYLLLISFFFFSCNDLQKKEAQYIIENFVEKHGFIAHKNFTTLLSTGSVVLGGPNNLIYKTFPHECFPEEILERHHKKIDFEKKHHYILNDIFNVFGLNISEVSKVHFEIEGLTIEALSFQDIYPWIENSMSEYCLEMLSYSSGFIVESLIADRIKISVDDFSNKSIYISSIFNFFNTNNIFWQSGGDNTLVITSPIYVGYKVARVRQRNDRVALDLSSKSYENHFIFRSLDPVPNRIPFISLFEEFRSFSTP